MRWTIRTYDHPRSIWRRRRILRFHFAAHAPVSALHRATRTSLVASSALRVALEKYHLLFQ